MQASLSLYTCSWVFFPFKIKDKFCLFWLFCTFWEKWRFMKPDASILLSPLREVILTMQNFLCWKLTLFFFTFPFFFFFLNFFGFCPIHVNSAGCAVRCCDYIHLVPKQFCVCVCWLCRCPVTEEAVHLMCSYDDTVLCVWCSLTCCVDTLFSPHNHAQTCCPSEMQFVGNFLLFSWHSDVGCIDWWVDRDECMSVLSFISLFLDCVSVVSDRLPLWLTPAT